MNAVSPSPVPPRAACGSLPQCLRHCESGDVLDDARSLVAFLRELVFLQAVAAHHDAETDRNAACRGLALATDLLADKLDIAAGVYHFSYVGGSGDGELAHREGGRK